MISQQQTQKQQLKILPQQIQLLNLYFLNTLELEQRIKNELEENPFLDNATEEQFDESAPSAKDAQDYQDWDEYGYDDTPDYKSEYQNYFHTDQTPNVALASYTHFKDEAKQQLRLLNIAEEERAMAEYIIDVLNNKGLMDKPLDEVADDLSFHAGALIDVEDLRKALKIVQSLEPIGIGATSIQECLLLQLKGMDDKRPDTRCALKLVQNHYNDLMHRQFEKIHHALNIDEEELRVILNLVGSLKFYPVSEEASNYEPKNTIIPDFIITRYGDAIQVNLYTSKSNSVFVNQSLYDQLSTQTSAKDRSSNQYVKSKLQSAQWFVNAVKQREDTMMRIMQCIVSIQHEYFLEGDIRLLKPMVLRNVADQSGLDISTVSRITSNKYAETHFGLIYLKDLFSEGIADKKGEVISNKVIQSVIEEAISNEDKRHPYTDQQLVNILSAKGYNIARRTVAKYREQLKIPIAQIRAVWA
ncbi:MAG: RNA polymerase sigma-54 factor [Sphingobacteriales bacterium]|nr:MAG: RNA polymerase sigma-54 factor [Sphingobacteriales bacterium]